MHLTFLPQVVCQKQKATNYRHVFKRIAHLRSGKISILYLFKLDIKFVLLWYCSCHDWILCLSEVTFVFILNWYCTCHTLIYYLLLIVIVCVFSVYFISLLLPGSPAVPLYGISMVCFSHCYIIHVRGCILEELLVSITRSGF